MKSFKRMMFWLAGGMAASLMTLLILAGGETRWPFKDGYIKILPIAHWPCHGGPTRFIKQRDGIYLAQICINHVIFCVFQTVRRAEAVNFLAQTKGVDLDL